LKQSLKWEKKEGGTTWEGIEEREAGGLFAHQGIPRDNRGVNVKRKGGPQRTRGQLIRKKDQVFPSKKMKKSTRIPDRKEMSRKRDPSVKREDGDERLGRGNHSRSGRSPASERKKRKKCKQTLKTPTPDTRGETRVFLWPRC